MTVLQLDWNQIFGVNKTSYTDDDYDRELDALLKKYEHVFDSELGCLKDCKVNIQIDKDADATPKFCKAGTVPLVYKDKVSEELDRLVNENILTPVTFF